jgi:hypothetical protein
MGRAASSDALGSRRTAWPNRPSSGLKRPWLRGGQRDKYNDAKISRTRRRTPNGSGRGCRFMPFRFPAPSRPGRKAGNPMQKCHSCGGPLGEDVRHRHGNCASCRSLIGTVAGLDAAIRADGDNPERFGPEWQEIGGLLRKLVGDRNDSEAWKEARCRPCAEGHRYFLTWPLPKLAEWLRAKALSAEGKPQGDGQHAAAAHTARQPKAPCPRCPREKHGRRTICGNPATA